MSPRGGHSSAFRPGPGSGSGRDLTEAANAALVQPPLVVSADVCRGSVQTGIDARAAGGTAGADVCRGGSSPDGATLSSSGGPVGGSRDAPICAGAADAVAG